ncbi:P-loop containing nucleoside triphosphate hydrolase protein, partial [Favolaschia claudopus]
IKDPKICPLPVPYFTGQQQILKKMFQYFRKDLGTRHIFVVHGRSGAGKTEVALKFIQNSQLKSHFSEIFYVDASCIQTLETDFKMIAPSVVGDSVNASLRWLASKHEEWLLFFDNADDGHLSISDFFPPCTFGNILITTRNREFCVHGAAFELSTMKIKDAQNLLLTLAREPIHKEEKDFALAIVKKLHCFALAVAQAGSYIHAHSTLKEFEPLYQNHHAKLQSHAEIQSQDIYSQAVYITWDLSYRKLSPPAKTSLQIFSQIHQEGITEEMFQNASLTGERLDDSNLQDEVARLLTDLGKTENGWNCLIFRERIRELQSCSLIKENLGDNSISIHPSVQHCTDCQDIKTIKKCVVGIIALSISFKAAQYIYKYKILPHINKQTELSIFMQNTMAADNITSMLEEQGQLAKVELLQIAICKRREQVLGKEHPLTLTSKANLASTYMNQGKWNDAKTLLTTLLEARQQVLGPKHPDTLISRESLAVAYSKLGQQEEALNLEFQVWAARECSLGKNHAATLHSLKNL